MKPRFGFRGPAVEYLHALLGQEKLAQSATKPPQIRHQCEKTNAIAGACLCPYGHLSLSSLPAAASLFPRTARASSTPREGRGPEREAAGVLARSATAA